MLEALQFFWKSWVVFLLGIILVFISFLIYQSMFIDPQYAVPYYDDDVCNVATIPIAGVMGIGVSGTVSDGTEEGGYSASANGDLDNILWKLDAAKSDDRIKAVMLQVDSGGGYGSVGEILASYLSKYPKPVVSYVRESAQSNAYWSILPSAFIVAHQTSSIGSIGVTMSYISNAKKNESEGLEYVNLSSGKFKDAGSPDKELTADEREYYISEIQKFVTVFKEDVAKYRKLSKEQVESLADGRSFMGKDALLLGLIDALGDEDTVKDWFDQNVFNNSEQKTIFCKPSY
jgi:protease-4